MRILTLAAAATALLMMLAVSASADPPMGRWVGDHNMIEFTLFPNGGYTMPNGAEGTQYTTWSWQQTSSTGGILTLNYDQYTVTQIFHQHMYFSV